MSFVDVKSVYLIQNPSGRELKDFLETPEDEVFLSENLNNITFIVLGFSKYDWKFVYELEKKFNIHVNFFDLTKVFESMEEFNAKFQNSPGIFLDRRNIIFDLKFKIERYLKKKYQETSL